MRRTARVLVYVLLLAVVCMSAEWRRSSGESPEVRIVSPQMNAELRGKVLINGRASLPQFDYYKVEFGIGPSPADWALIGDIHKAPVVEGLLETWDTTTLPDGMYSLRIRVVKPDGNYEEHFVPQVKIVNAVPTATVTPTASPTLPPATIPVGSTYTPAVTKPTAALAQPTATPTLARPTRAAAAPLGDIKDYRNALCLGAGAMGVIFLLVGLVLAIRRVL